MSERNLTKERQLAYLRRQKATALSQVGKTETMVVATVKRDKKGNEAGTATWNAGQCNVTVY